MSCAAEKSLATAFYRVQERVFFDNQGRVDLSSFPYWRFRSELPGITKSPAIIPFGSVYSPHNIITEEVRWTLSETIRRVSDEIVVLVPHVRTGCQLSVLVDLGFFLIPVAGESIAIPSKPMDCELYLRSVLGRKRYSDHRRYARRATSNYTVKSFSLNEIVTNDTQLNECERLMQLHEFKYGNSTNAYGARFIQALASENEVKDEFKVSLRYAQNNKVVQYMLHRFDNRNKTIYFIATAIDRSSVAPNENLYTAAMIEAYSSLQNLQFKSLHLGRGNRETKSRYGCNEYVGHVHAVYVQAPRLKTEISRYLVASGASGL